jgi:hypothetical protein
LYKRPDGVEKWCDIHWSGSHSLEECRIYQEQKKKDVKAAPAQPEPHRGEHRRADANGDEEDHYPKSGVIFRGSTAIVSKTKSKKN